MADFDFEPDPYRRNKPPEDDEHRKERARAIISNSIFAPGKGPEPASLKDRAAYLEKHDRRFRFTAGDETRGVGNDD